MRREFTDHGQGAWSVRVAVGFGATHKSVRTGSVFPPTTENIRAAMRSCVKALRIAYDRPAKKT